jgi:hypothetical protein
MMDGLTLLLVKNDDERKGKIEFLLAGSAKDYAEYRHICGVIRGLNLADAHIRDLAERMQKQNDDDGA